MAIVTVQWGRNLLEGLVADSPEKDERALRAACNSIPGPDRALEWHVNHTSRAACGVKAAARNLSRRTTDRRVLMVSGRERS